MPIRFYYTNSKNQPTGPVEAAEIAWLADSGIIDESTLIIAEGEQTWSSYRRWHQEFRGSVRLPKPLTGPAPEPPSKGGRKWAVSAAALTVLIASGGWYVRMTAQNQPDKPAIVEFVAAAVSRRGLRLSSLQSETKNAGPDRVHVFYRALAATEAPLYSPIDAQEYLREHFGEEAGKRVGATAPALTLLRPSTAAGVSVTISGRLVGVRARSGWRLSEEVDRQFSSPAPDGLPRPSIPGKTFVVGDPDEEAALKSLVEQATAPAGFFSAASPKLALMPAPAASLSSSSDIALAVPANVKWVDTGIDLEFGETISINAHGVITRGPPLSATATGSNGGETPDGEPLLNSNDDIRSLPAPLLPAWSLIGKVGTSVPFEVGSFTTFHAPSDGRLFLSVNSPNFDSGTGAWRATLKLPQKAPPADASTSSLAGPDAETSH